MIRASLSCLVLAAGVASAVAVGCSSPAAGTKPLPEHTGGMVMEITSVPSDVQCVEINTSDYRTSQVRVDVTPGTTATVPVAPLDPGVIYVWGQAYDVPCESLGYGYPTPTPYYPDAGLGYADSGPQTPASHVTWLADSIPVTIFSGQYTNADLHFHQLGGANVTIDWDSCDGGGGNFYYCGGDGGPPIGPDGGPPVGPDGGPPPIGPDGGPPVEPDASYCPPAYECNAVGCSIQVGSDGCSYCECPIYDAGIGVSDAGPGSSH
jgi:hypothetical protein